MIKSIFFILLAQLWIINACYPAHLTDFSRAFYVIVDEEDSASFHQQDHSKSANAQSFVTQENFNNGLINDPISLIESRVAGLSIVKPGGDPNEVYETRIRGLSNIFGSTSPLIIIDGILDAQLENLDPNDVESFEILKDVAATAFYGIRGANGVILIQTKRGQSGDLRLSYNTYFNVESAIRRNNNMSRDAFVSLSNELDYDFNRFGAETDWYDEILQKGLSQVHNLSISGGSGKTDYYISMNYRGVEGTLKSTGFDRFNTRFNLEHRALNDKLTIGMNIGATFNRSELIDSDVFKYAAIYSPTAPVKSDDPQYDIYDGYFQQVLFDYYNPVAMIEQNTHNVQDKRWNAQLSGAYEILKNLNFKLSYAFQTASTLENQYQSKFNLGAGMNRNGLAQKEVNDTYSQLFQSSLVWKPEFDNGSLNVLAGYAYQEYMNEGFGASGGDFITDSYAYNRLNAANDFDNGLGFVDSYKNSNKIIGFFGSADFKWKQTYFISLVGRYDGSSRFGDNEKYGFYPGISAGIDLAKILSMNMVDLLKVRLGTGKSGQEYADSYLSQDLMEQSWGYMYYGGAFKPFYALINEKNPNLKAPTKTEVNVGLDFQIWKGRLSGSIDYYSNYTQDLLLEYNVATPPNLVSRKWVNIGELKNKGLEFCLTGVVVESNSFLYQASLIMSKYIDNSFGSLSDPENGYEFGERFLAPGSFWANAQIIHVAENTSVGDFWGYEYQGISEDGDWIHKDLNQDGQIDYDDRRQIGNGLPKFELGFGNAFKYKNWDIHLFFKGIFGYDLLSQYKLRYGYPSQVSSYNTANSALELKNANGVYLRSFGGPYSTYHREKGNYFKLANFNIGYNFKLAETSEIKAFRIYLMGQNLFVITNYSGSDPEARFSSDVPYSYNHLAPGVEPVNSWLMTRSFALGLNVTF